MRSATSGSASVISDGNLDSPNMFHRPSPAAFRKTRANGSLIRGLSLSVSRARDPATPSAVAPTLSVMSQLSLSVLAIINLPQDVLARRHDQPYAVTPGWPYGVRHDRRVLCDRRRTPTVGA